MKIIIRNITKSDIPELKQLLDTIELFPSDMLDDMVADYFSNLDTQEIWYTATEENKPISIGYCTPEILTEGTYNLYAIGVKSEIQGKGIGSQMMDHLEIRLREQGHRILIVETSGAPEFHLTRKFYEKLGYHKEAVIRDFWREGEDKIIYRKKLN